MDVGDAGPKAEGEQAPPAPLPRASSTSPARRRPAARRASAPGVGLAFDVAAAALSTQMTDVDGINSRLGGVLAATLALAGIAVLGQETALFRDLTGVALVLAMALTAWASRASRWSSAPDPGWLAQFAGDDPDFMKEAALPGVLRCLERNRAQIERKARLLNWGVASLAAGGLLLLVGRILAG
ncbi:MAG TPA: hypothetical protein VNH20_00220 [Candidatus Dormibacteraeota bacterium]|nr:hypothetical protein [Candidatus Dormibacteraeota bacterium]